MTARTRRVMRALLALALAAGGLWAANLWLYHGWASSGPPTPRPEWHRAWSVRFFWVMCACFGALAVLAVRAVRRWSKPAS